jgi:hypothetical protein
MANNDLRPSGPKKNHKKGYLATDKLRKRTEAVARQAAYAKVPFEQKLAQAGAKERAKLLARSQK